jgi:hypothetical protein
MPNESTRKGFSRHNDLHGTASTAQDRALEEDTGAKSRSVKAAQQAVENERQALESGEESSA